MQELLKEQDKSNTTSPAHGDERIATCNMEILIRTVSGTLKPKCPAPGADIAEIKGTQSWLHLLFKAIGTCIEEITPVKKTNSPARKHVRIENIVRGAKRSRQADFTLHKQARFEAVLRNSSLQTIPAVKPDSRVKDGIMKLLNKAFKQELSHAAKKLSYGLDFLRVGVDTHVTFFIANMATVRVVNLSLK